LTHTTLLASRPMRRRVAALLTGASLLSLVSAPPAHAAVVVVNVSQRLTSQSEAAVAASPLDPDDVAIASNIQHGYGIFVAISHDAGDTWSRDVIGNDDEFGRACCDPTITWDEQGNLFLGWLGYGKLRYPTFVTIAQSNDAGDTWSLFDRIKPPAPDIPTRAAASVTARASDGGSREDEEERGPGFIDQPTLTSGPHSLWAIWNNDGQMQATGARVRGLGDVRAIKRVRDIPNAYNCTFGDIAVGPGGAVAEVCQKDRDRHDPVDSVFRFTVDPDGLRPRRFVASRVVATTNVSLFEPIRPQHVRTVDAEVALAWLRAGPHRGRLVMMFNDEFPDQSDDTNVYVKISRDDGETWSSRVAVTAAARSQFLPRLAVDTATGDLVAGWHDASLDDGSGIYDTDGRSNSDAMYTLAFSGDAGRTWTAPQMVSDQASNAAASGNGIEFGDYTGLAFAFGIARPAWADNSNSTGDNPDGVLNDFDIYAAAVPMS
jgi:hypothetical protein